MTRKSCVYCNREITTPSREHVIQNALGGLLESEDICCPGCNNYISQEIDKPFTTIFNPLLGGIDDMAKTNNKKSNPPYTGKVLYNNQLYTAGIKAGRVVSCPELSRQLRCDISKLPLEIVSYDFKLDNTAFHNGIAKIAFNYALACGVDFDLMRPGMDIQKSGDAITGITFKYPLVPFYPLNPIDAFIELETAPELYHNIILFSQHSELWCYIDLFNTFQYYVLLSDSVPNGTDVHNSYAQTLKKIDRSEPDIQIFGPKDIMIYAQQYGVQPCMDIDEMKRRIKNAIASKSQKQSLKDIIGKKLSLLNMFCVLQGKEHPGTIPQIWGGVRLYLDQNEQLRERNFRTLTVTPDGMGVLSYPRAIAETLAIDDSALRMYTDAKFRRLTNMLKRQK